MYTVSDSPLGLVAKAAFPAGVTGMTWFGYSLPDIVYMLTIIYLVLQICNMFYNWLLKGQRNRILRRFFNGKSE